MANHSILQGIFVKLEDIMYISNESDAVQLDQDNVAQVNHSNFIDDKNSVYSFYNIMQ